MDDKNFNEFLPLGLGFFDAVILAQSCTVGILLTEDSRLLHLKDIGVKIVIPKSLCNNCMEAQTRFWMFPQR